MPGLPSQLEVYGRLGYCNPPLLALYDSASAAFKAARKVKGGIKNLRQVRAGGNGTGKGRRFEGGVGYEGHGEAPAIVPTFSNIFPESFNTASNWTATATQTSVTVSSVVYPFLVNTPGNFRKGDITLAWTDNRPNTNVELATAGGLEIPANTAHSIRFLLTQPAEDQALALFKYRWGALSTGCWQFQIINGVAEMMKLSADWTEANEDALCDLLALDEPDDTDQSAIDDLRTLLYDEYETLNLGIDAENWYGTPHELTFDPEPYGFINVTAQGAGTDTVQDRAIQKTRTTGTLWAATSARIISAGGMFFFEYGYPAFALSGSLIMRSFLTSYWQSGGLGSLVFNSLAHKPTGTNIVIAVEEISATRSAIVARWTSSDRRQAARLYTLSAYLDPGALNTGTDIVLDTNDHLRGDGSSPVLEVSMSCEGETHRRQFNIELHNMNGTLLDAEAQDNSLQSIMGQRVASLAVNGVPVAGRGLITEASQSGLREATYNVIPSVVSKAKTRTRLQLCDMWVHLESVEVGRDPVVNNMFLSDAIRRCLKAVGFADADLAGIPVGVGRRLPPEVPGEDCAIRPNGGTMSSFLRQLLEQWGMGWSLYQNPVNGYWTFALMPTTIMAHFKKDSEVLGTADYRHRIFDDLEFVEDVSEFANCFRVVGGDDEDGSPIIAEDKRWESFQVGLGPRPLTWIGREIWKVVNAPHARTQADANWILASLRTVLYLPPRYRSFTTHWHGDLLPGMRVAVSGRVCKIARIPSASIRGYEGRMQLMCRELGLAPILA